MLVNIPIFFIAKQISVMNIVGLLVAADGTATEDPASFANLKNLGIFDRLEVQCDPGLVEIHASGALVKNYQDEILDYNATLSCLDKNGKQNPLIDLSFYYSYIKITATGMQSGTGGTAQKTLTLYCKTGVMGTGYLEGRNATTLALHTCGQLPQWAA